MLISKRAEELFASAHALESDARQRYVAKACGDDRKLYDEISSLLAAAGESEAYFTQLSGQLGLAAAGDDDTPLPADKIVGQWRLLRLIGRGGMGAVYLAERADGQFDQRAALKILPIGLADDQARARFLNERQILARLVHDNIARLLDGGVTEDGTPYFVMDFVEGTPIDDYCSRHELTVERRLELIVDVARGVQFAHRNLIIHRDLKPGNVLVEESGRTRLLDFGIAKVLEPMADDTGLTQFAQRPVTPLFASPEMLRGEPVDVTTDVYSIGVILYLLLAGRPPLVYEGMSLTDMHGHAATVVPPPVSRFNKHLGGDIDAILGKALAKSPGERYESVAALARDIRNYLDDLPVAAKPPSVWYRVRKFVSRHRLSVAFAASAMLALAVITLLALHSAVTTARQSRAIALERDRAESTKEFLVSIFGSADPTRSAADLTAREILDAGRERIGKELADQPQVQADLLTTIGEVYGVLGLMTEWREALEKERDLRADLTGTHSQEYADVLLRLAFAEDQDGSYDNSMQHATEALALSRRLGSVLGEAEGLTRVARIHHLRGNYDGAESHYRQALAIYQLEFGDDSFEAASAKVHLGALFNHREQYQDAYVLLQEAVATRERLDQRDDAERTDALLALASTLNQLKRHDEAVSVYQRTFAMNDRLFGPDNSYNLYVVNGLGQVALTRGDFATAAKRFRDARRLLLLHTPQSPNLGRANANIGKARMLEGRYDLAIPLFRGALAILQQHIPDHWFIGEVQWRLGRCLFETGDYAAAEPLILEGMEILEAQWGTEHYRTREAYQAVADLDVARGKLH